MSRLEDELREALRRREPPDGFAERVLRLAASAGNRQSRWQRWRAAFRTPLLRMALATACGCLLVTGAYFYHLREERIRGERAKEEVVLALRVTAVELDRALQTVQGLNSAR